MSAAFGAVLLSVAPRDRHSTCSHMAARGGQWRDSGSTFNAVLALELVQGLALGEAAAGLPAVSGVEGPARPLHQQLPAATTLAAGHNCLHLVLLDSLVLLLCVLCSALHLG